MEADPLAWSELAAAVVVASVAFAGFIFVSISINLQEVISLAGIADLALAGIMALTGIAISGVLLLVPGQPTGILATELVLLGLFMLAWTLRLYSRSYRVTAADYKRGRLVGALLNGTPGVSIMVCGLSLATAVGGGFYWLVPGWIVAIVGGVLNAWVLLVEVKR
ncbi:MAG TPA: hypothetical protein VH371_06820 [Candidatus Limnocylindrales bacterium]|jgi:modulator of FtsH protease